MRQIIHENLIGNIMMGSKWHLQFDALRINISNPNLRARPDGFSFRVVELKSGARCAKK